jgi:hypothetical protein
MRHACTLERTPGDLFAWTILDDLDLPLDRHPGRRLHRPVGPDLPSHLHVLKMSHDLWQITETVPELIDCVGRTQDRDGSPHLSAPVPQRVACERPRSSAQLPTTCHIQGRDAQATRRGQSDPVSLRGCRGECHTQKRQVHHIIRYPPPRPTCGPGARENADTVRDFAQPRRTHKHSCAARTDTEGAHEIAGRRELLEPESETKPAKGTR